MYMHLVKPLNNIASKDAIKACSISVYPLEHMSGSN